jgi:hypothetical protein
MSHGSDEWYDGPRAAAGIKLFRIRAELREKNLHDSRRLIDQRQRRQPGDPLVGREGVIGVPALIARGERLLLTRRRPGRRDAVHPRIGD